jgi:hypothetical protein
LGYTDTFNLYEYVASTPLRSLDPSGRGLEWVLFVITVSKGGIVVAVILVVLLAVAWAIIRLVEQIKAWYRKDDCEDVEVRVDVKRDEEEDEESCHCYCSGPHETGYVGYIAKVACYRLGCLCAGPHPNDD